MSYASWAQDAYNEMQQYLHDTFADHSFNFKDVTEDRIYFNFDVWSKDNKHYDMQVIISKGSEVSANHIVTRFFSAHGYHMISERAK